MSLINFFCEEGNVTYSWKFNMEDFNEADGRLDLCV